MDKINEKPKTESVVANTLKLVSIAPNVAPKQSEADQRAQDVIAKTIALAKAKKE